MSERSFWLYLAKVVAMSCAPSVIAIAAAITFLCSNGNSNSLPLCLAVVSYVVTVSLSYIERLFGFLLSGKNETYNWLVLMFAPPLWFLFIDHIIDAWYVFRTRK